MYFSHGHLNMKTHSKHLIFQIVLRRRGTFIRCDQSALRMIDVFVAQENILQNCNITL